MKVKLIVMVACFCIVAVSRAEVVLILNETSYHAPQAIEYHFGTGVFEFDFEKGMVCSGDSISEPGDGLSVRFHDQYYALDGDIVLDFSINPARLVMTSKSGNLVCQFDRVYSDRFVLL